MAWNACFNFACNCKAIPKIAIVSYHSQPRRVSRGIICHYSQYVLLKWERGKEKVAIPSVQFSYKTSFTNKPDTTSIRSLILTSVARCNWPNLPLCRVWVDIFVECWYWKDSKGHLVSLPFATPKGIILYMLKYDCLIQILLSGLLCDHGQVS